MFILLVFSVLKKNKVRNEIKQKQKKNKQNFTKQMENRNNNNKNFKITE